MVNDLDGLSISTVEMLYFILITKCFICVVFYMNLTNIYNCNIPNYMYNVTA